MSRFFALLPDINELWRGITAAITPEGTIAAAVLGFMVGALVFGRHRDWPPRLAAELSLFVTSAWYLAALFDVAWQGDDYLMGRTMARLVQAGLFAFAVAVGVAYRRFRWKGGSPAENGKNGH